MIASLNELALNILRGINNVVGNYGWSIVVFTVLIRLVLSPFDFKSRVGMRKMSSLSAKQAELQRKYGKDQAKLNQKLSELYKKEGASPMSGCLPMLLSYPILIWMFTAMRAFANEQVVRQVLDVLQNPETMPVLDSWLWIKNLWMPDSPFASALVDLNTLRQVPTDVWTRLVSAESLQQVAALHPDLAALTMDSFGQSNLSATIQLVYNTLSQTPVYIQNAGGLPGWSNIPLLFFSISIMKEFNGLLILPILSSVSQFFMSAILGNQTPQPAAGTQQQQQSQQSTANFMKWFFPIFSLWICLTSNAAFALYWVTSNLIMTGISFIINKYLDSKDTKNTVSGEASIK